MGMPKLHYPKQPWFSSIAVLTSFVNESPLENGVDLQQPNYFCLGLKAQQNRKHAWAMHSEKKKQRINKHVQGHVLAMHQTYLHSSMSSKTTETTYAQKTILKSYTSTCEGVL